MCGIFAYSGAKSNAGDIILTGLKCLEYRGYDSWGVAVKKSAGDIYIEKHTGKIGTAKLPTINTTIGIGHTRWATHGGVTEQNAHPHIDCTKKVIIVHNGIVENFGQIKQDLQKKGHTFISETDSEVIAHLIEELKKSETDLKKVMMDTFKRLTGLSAIIAFFPDDESFYVVKNGSPIVFGLTPQNEYIIASDASAIIEHTKKVYFLNDEEILYVGRNICQLYDQTGEKKNLEFTTLQYEKEDVSMGDYPHFMIKEINEQPKVLLNIIATQQQAIHEAAELIKKSYGAYLVGCGTASYACLAGTYLFSKIAKRHINFAIASEFSYLMDFIKDTSLIIPLSQSGETIDIISGIKKVKDKKAKVLAITNTIGSTLYRLADYKLMLHAGPEKAVASTKAYTAKIALLYLLAHQIASTLSEGLSNLELAINEVKKLISNKETIIEPLINTLQVHEHIFILGRGVSYGAALESALKIKEVSYIHAEGFAAGELKHGVIALIEKGTPVIVYNPEDETYEDTLSSAYEVKARGGYVIGVSSKKNDVYDSFIEVKNCADATIIPEVVIAQLLGYYLALARGYDPDKPRNLAKSVTVK